MEPGIDRLRMTAKSRSICWRLVLRMSASDDSSAKAEQAEVGTEKASNLPPQQSSVAGMRRTVTIKYSTGLNASSCVNTSLPHHVVCVCSLKPGRERYGVKLSVKRRQLRVGSRYSDAESASAVNRAFMAVVRLDLRGQFHIVEKLAAEHRDLLNCSCSMYKKWSSELVTLTVRAVLENWLVQEQIVKKSRKRKRATPQPQRHAATILRCIADIVRRQESKSAEFVFILQSGISVEAEHTDALPHGPSESSSLAEDATSASLEKNDGATALLELHALLLPVHNPLLLPVHRLHHSTD